MEADISLHLFLQGHEWQSRDGLCCGQGNCAAARMAELFRKRAWLPPHLWPSEHQINPITGTQRPLACWPLFKGQWPFPGRSGKKASLSAREPSLSSLLRRHRQSHQPWRQQGHLSKPHLEQAGGAQGLQEGRGPRPSEAVPGLRANMHRQAVLQGQMDGGKVLLVSRIGQKGACRGGREGQKLTGGSAAVQALQDEPQAGFDPLDFLWRLLQGAQSI